MTPTDRDGAGSRPQGRIWLRRLWRMVPQRVRHALFGAAMAGRTQLRDRGQALGLAIRAGVRRRHRPERGGRCTVVGLFSSRSGMGQAALLNAEALSLAGYAVELLDYHPADRSLMAYGHLSPHGAPADPSDLVLVQLNPPQCSQALQAFLARENRRRRQIGFWVWETEEAPRSWRRHAFAFDEIWTPSRFCADALRRFRPKLRVMPHPSGLSASDRDGLGDDARGLARGRLGLDREAFVVAFAFDMRSSFRRKNALGLVEAFRRAFGPETTARLVLRVLSREVYPVGWAELCAVAAREPSVVLLDAGSEIVDLYRACDVYASLHRSEGFGMTLAEAMLSARPVVATGWSGNLDFMDEDTARLIPFTLVPVADPQGAYAADQRWAEPDVDSAAQALRDLADSPDVRRELGEKARAAVIGRLSRLPDPSILAGPSTQARASTQAGSN